jgi:hypothetical protein
MSDSLRWFMIPFSVLCAAINLGADETIQLKTSPDHRLFIYHPGHQAEWQIRIPEVVEAQEGTFMTSVRPEVTWKEFEPGLVGYDWSGATNYTPAVERATGGRIKIIRGLTISPRVKVRGERVEFELRLQNTSAETFHDVTADGGCLTHRSERFFDDHYTNSFIITKRGLTSLDQTDRSMKIRAKYFFHPAWFESPTTKAYEFFWGRSETRPAEALIVSRAGQGSGAVGIAWDHCMGLRQNSDAGHRCMHSSPYFGDLRPGATITRRGVLFWGDTVEKIVEEFKRESFKLHTDPPRKSQGTTQ